MTQDTTLEAANSPFDIPVPSPIDVLPAGSAAASFEGDTPDGYIPASHLEEPTTDTRDSGLTSMEKFLNPIKPEGVVGLAGDAALDGAEVDYTESQ